MVFQESELIVNLITLLKKIAILEIIGKYRSYKIASKVTPYRHN
jgi:hypothetical protein